MADSTRSPNASLPRTPIRRSASDILQQFLPGAKTEHKMDILKKSPGESSIKSTPRTNYKEMNPINRSTVVTPVVQSPLKSVQQSPEQLQPSPASGMIDLTTTSEQPAVDPATPQEDNDEVVYGRPTRSRRSALRLNTRAPKSIDQAERQHIPAPRSQLVRQRAIGPDFTPLLSKRAEIRKEIASKTAAYRNHFFVEKKEFWLPLLPPHNYVAKLVNEYSHLSPEMRAQLPVITPYEELAKQPAGVRATMKPYQLSGLSFMLYLHRNGLSGILGDEMGLGKTLQTLSLIQYLKENDPKSGAGRAQRPFLVVCPLSVLSSWMAEAKKWTPGLKAIRFHGPIAERTRMKKIVVGEIDMYGRLTAQAKQTMKSRRNASGKSTKTAINLDSDSEDEVDVGVDLVVTTYDCFKAEASWFKSAFVWRYIVLDEGHTVKNHASLISKSLQGVKAEFRLILTGTPVQNNLEELWSLLHFLYPEVFTDNTKTLFVDSFNLSKGHYSSEVLDNARRLLEHIMLRRMKNSPGVDLNLPPKTEVLLFIPLSPMQQFWYTRMITKIDQGLLDEVFNGAKTKEEEAINKLREAEAREADALRIETEALKVLEDDSLKGTDAWKETRTILNQTLQRERELDGESKQHNWRKLMNLIMQLRKVCNHPYSIRNAEPDPYESGEHVIHASGKFIVLDKLIGELVVNQKKQILIFSGFTKILDLVEEMLSMRGGDGSSYRFMRIDGSTARARRNLGIRLFNDLTTNVRVMLISTRAGGMGINLASASDVVLLDQDWNPQITLQAEARAHRIGQKNPVTVYKFVSQGTVEEQMMGRIQKKLYLSAKVTESMQDIHTQFGTGTPKKKKKGANEEEEMPQLNTTQLMSLIRRGASAISQPSIDISNMLSWDWNTTVAKCKDQAADVLVLKDAVPDAKVDEEEERIWLSKLEKVESTVFGGKKLTRGKGFLSNKDLASEYAEISREDRRVGKNTTIMVDGFAVSKESMNCEWGEAVPTFAGKDPTLASPKRAKKTPIVNQDYCQVCMDGGEMHHCQICPRAYHMKCLNRTYQTKAKGWQFVCPQHNCSECSQGTGDAGGMLYRCRWCESAFCEDCLDFDNTILLGDNLKEYELLSFAATDNAYYIRCPNCKAHFKQAPHDKKLIDSMETMFDVAYADYLPHLSSSNAHSTRAGSLTDATTIETESVNTPAAIDPDDVFITPRKRKAEFNAPSSNKRERFA